MIVVLDTNCFWGDREATREALTTLFELAQQGRCTIAIPEAVIAELVNQYPDMLDEAITEAETAVSKNRSRLARFGITLPVFTPPDDVEDLMSSYEERLRSRLEDAGCRLVATPDMRPMLQWSIEERKPFGSEDVENSVADACVWLTVLSLAKEDDVVLVSANRKDFAARKGSTDFHPALANDVKTLPHNVRLLLGVGAIIKELTPDATDVGLALLTDKDASLSIERELYGQLIHSEISQEDLHLPVALDSDPLIDSFDVMRLALLDASIAEDGKLFLEIEAFCDAYLDVYIYKPDFWGLRGDEGIDVVNADHNDHYVSAQTETQFKVRCSAVFSDDGDLLELNVDEPQPLTGANEFARQLSNDDVVNLMNEVRAVVDHNKIDIRDYRPPEAIESDIESSVVSVFHPTSVNVRSVSHEVEDGLRVIAHVAGDTSVEWMANAPSGMDLELFSEYAQGNDDGAGWLVGTADAEPIVITSTADFADGKWTQVEVMAKLDDDVAQERFNRVSASERYLRDRDTPEPPL